MYSYLAGYWGVWFKYEVKAMEQITNLPLKGEGIEIVAHVADRLSYLKLMMGHLDLAIALGTRAHKMWALLQNPNQHYAVLCRLSKSLLLKNGYKQLIQVLGTLWELSVTGHIFSKEFFLYFVYRTFAECLDFIIQNENNRILKFHNGLLLGLYSSVAVW
ncbi:adenylate cyclase type 10 [Ochotona princeps]|uniref:adenylate cyclase type 10 n=1 Tax=Ochotona princeps TaxID=9978 RepID=UPI0027144B9A|nr:adenylate cyclase type 10 [Ochotona princeps]